MHVFIVRGWLFMLDDDVSFMVLQGGVLVL